MKSSLSGNLSCFVVICLLFTTKGLPAGGPQQTEWQPLFDGKTLSGWEVLEDEGKFFVTDGSLVGETAPGVKSSYLCTKESFDDFILEVDFKVDEGLNSGVQIRSGTYEEETTTLYMTGRLNLVSHTYGAGRLFGYQVEIDTSERAWTGGFYEQGRRGWLQTLEYNKPARKAFKQGEWNHFRIEAINDSFKTWLNGVPATDTRDCWSKSGRIGLQLHGSKDPGKQVRFRNLRIQTIE
ncbi:MAG: 3-keto-disaccharide hydrolase [bacterium]